MLNKKQLLRHLPSVRNATKTASSRKAHTFSKAIETVDWHFTGTSEFACAYIVPLSKTSCAIVESATSKGIPFILNSLQKRGYTPDQVKYIIPTHIHLDHAGGAGLLMNKYCKNATLLIHPRGSKHLIDPQHLIKSVKQVYGEKEYMRLYDPIEPIEQARIREMKHAEVLVVSSPAMDEDNNNSTFPNNKNTTTSPTATAAIEKREFTFLHTRGHAKHHFCVFDSESQGVFTGDSFGNSYPLFSHKFIFPSTSPVDFEEEEAHKTVDRIVDFGARRAYLTHFGEWTNMKEARNQLHYGLERMGNVYRYCKAQLSVGDRSPEFLKKLEQEARQQVLQYFEERMDKYDIPKTPKVFQFLKLDIDLNAAGLLAAARRELDAS